jgi:clan AA aspartic protease
MITGVVNDDLEPVIELVVLGHDGKQHSLTAVVDTGFNGFLTLPPAHVRQFQMPWLGRQPGLLADGTTRVFDVHVETVLWDGQPISVETETAEGTPLVGMSLLLEHTLAMHIRKQGTITIDRKKA